MSKRLLAVLGLVALSPSSFANPALDLSLLLTPLSIGIVGGRDLKGVKPVGGLFVARYEEGKVVDASPFCSGTLLENGYFLTATHCFVGFLESDGKITPPRGTRLVVSFEERGPAAEAPVFPVVGLYHQFPAVDSRAFLGWSSYTSPQGAPSTPSVMRVASNDVALVKLGNAGALEGYVKAAEASALEAGEKDLRVAGYGVSRVGLDAVLLGDGAGRRRVLDVETSERIEGITTLTTGRIGRAADSPAGYIGIHKGDSGGFVGHIDEKTGAFTVKGVSLSMSRARPGNAGSVPFRLRSLDTSLLAWIKDGRGALADAPADGLTTVSAPLDSLADIKIRELGELLPPWGFPSQPMSQLVERFAMRLEDVKITSVEKDAKRLGQDKLRAVLLEVPATWHGESFTALIPLSVKTSETMLRLQTALEENLPILGLPECLKRDAFDLLIAEGDSALLGFMSRIEARVGTDPHGHAIQMPGFTSCEDVEEIY